MKSFPKEKIMHYDLIVVHRVCPILASTAALYDDKFEMVKATTISLSKALKGIKAKLIVILDGCDDEYKNLFNDVFGHGRIQGVDYECVSTSSIGNCLTFAKQHELCERYLEAAEYLYFSEDDYIYSDCAFRAMMDFLKHPDVDFVTPLDHPDRYTHIVPERIKVEVRVSDYCHWREVGTTCCTFMTKKSIFKKTRNRLFSYAKGAGDGGMWISITRDMIFNFPATIGALFSYLTRRRRSKEGLEFSVLAAWRFHKWRMLFGRRYHLWGPCPTLAVHLCKPSLPAFHSKLITENQHLQ